MQSHGTGVSGVLGGAGRSAPAGSGGGVIAVEEVARGGRPPAVCAGCGVRPVAYRVLRVDVCFACLPGGPHVPPPCTVCGRTGFFYHQGLCTACHPFSPERRDACPDCFAWGTSRRSGW